MKRLLLSLLVSSCAAPEGRTEMALSWDRDNDPTALDPTFVHDVALLPVEGQPATVPPGVGWYWPAYRDGIDHRMIGATSPAEKYERLADAGGVGWAASWASGVLSYADDARSCTEDKECASGSRCGRRRGASSGTCIPTWHGLCDGWAGIAATEPAATRTVTRHGVTFAPIEIEALAAQLFSETGLYTMIGVRCTERAVNGDPSCRDWNPGSFHLVLANVVGLRKRSFVLDDHAGEEVWNRPVVRYRAKVREITASEAMALASGTAMSSIALVVDKETSGPLPSDAGSHVIRYVPSGEASVKLRLERWGQKACEASAQGGAAQCLVTLEPGQPFVYTVTASARDEGRLELVRVEPAPYAFNARAARLFHVVTRVTLATFVDPSAPPPAYLGPLDREYQYIVETTASGRILGGEWVGASVAHHPDFGWVPEGAPTSAAGGRLRYDDVKSLIEESAGRRRNFTSHLVNPHVLSHAGTLRPAKVGVPGVR
jgi:hypothetical protein